MATLALVSAAPVLPRFTSQPARPLRVRPLLPAALGLLALLAPLAPVRAQAPAAVQAQAAPEGVVERVARTGTLVLTGPMDSAPLLSLDAQGRPQGYGVEVARRVAADLSTAVGRTVTLRFEPGGDPLSLGQRLAEGQVDLACGIPFSWERDMSSDYSLPIGLSGLRLLAPAGRLDGSPASLAGRRIGVVQESLAQTELQGMQPAAKAVAFPSLKAAVTALQAGQLDGVIGDTLLLANFARSSGAKGLAITPEQPYERYAVACLLPENDSAFRNLVNLAIARLLQGYIDGQPEAMAAVDRWVGPGSPISLPPDRIRTYFETVLLGVEAIRPLPAPAARP